MKNLFTPPPPPQIRLVLCSLIILFNSAIKAQEIDSTWLYIIANSDTMYIEGLDTIYVIDNETGATAVGRSSYTDSDFASKKNYIINLSSQNETVNKGLFGVHISGMFKTNALYEDEYSETQWQWMAELAPKSLRFPSGSNGKLAHLLNNGDKGYGLNIEEIIRFYDASDGEIDLTATDISNKIAEIEYYCNSGGADAENACLFFDEYEYGSLTWMLNDAIDVYTDDILEYVQQTFLPEGDKFINQFIRLVKQIEEENPGHTVDIIYCANILSEPASEVRAIIDYMRDNPIHNLNVVGVELGNEVYNAFHYYSIGFHTFGNYFNYLRGISFPPYTTTYNLYNSDPATNPLFQMTSDFDFLAYLKEDPTFNIKIGLPADNLNSGEFIFFSPTVGTRSTSEWNNGLRLNYFVTEGITGFNRYYFDAVVLHPYYDSRSHWADNLTNPIDGLQEEYICGVDGDTWNFDITDERLADAFENLLMHWNRFIKDSIDLAYQEFNNELDFDLTTTEKKELWTTEWNLKITKLEEEDNTFREYTAVNGFTHGYLIQEWWLKNLRLNYDSHYKKNFFKYSTIQNYASGSNIQLLTPADNPDEFIYYNITDPIYFPTMDCTRPLRSYYLKRTTMFSNELLSEVSKKGLRYLKTTHGTFSSNINIPPTTFVDIANQKLYIYYSNGKYTEQKYMLTNVGNMLGMYPEGYSITLDHDASAIHCVNAKQLYSTSGKSTLYDINSCYTSENYEPEITGIETILDPDCTSGIYAYNNNCYQVPDFSFGYIEIPFTVIETPPTGRLYNSAHIQIYPNPATSVIYVSGLENENSRINLYDIVGTPLISQKLVDQKVNISQLVAGTYVFEILNDTDHFITQIIVIK